MGVVTTDHAVPCGKCNGIGYVVLDHYEHIEIQGQRFPEIVYAGQRTVICPTCHGACYLPDL